MSKKIPRRFTPRNDMNGFFAQICNLFYFFWAFDTAPEKPIFLEA